jgi:hypothetical protein
MDLKEACLPLTGFTVEHRNTYTHMNTQCRHYKPTPNSRALLEKLTGGQLVQKIPTIYGPLMFITFLKTAYHWALHKQVQSHLHPMTIFYNIFLPHTPMRVNALLTTGVQTSILYTFLIPPTSLQSYPTSSEYIKHIWQWVQIINLIIYNTASSHTPIIIKQNSKSVDIYTHSCFIWHHIYIFVKIKPFWTDTGIHLSICCSSEEIQFCA